MIVAGAGVAAEFGVDGRVGSGLRTGFGLGSLGLSFSLLAVRTLYPRLRDGKKA